MCGCIWHAETKIGPQGVTFQFGVSPFDWKCPPGSFASIIRVYHASTILYAFGPLTCKDATTNTSVLVGFTTGTVSGSLNGGAATTAGRNRVLEETNGYFRIVPSATTALVGVKVSYFSATTGATQTSGFGDVTTPANIQPTMECPPGWLITGIFGTYRTLASYYPQFLGIYCNEL